MDTRPTGFADFVGQSRAAAVLSVLVRSALKKGTCVPHVLLTGPPGLGKTTLARIVAAEMGSRLVEIVAGNIQTAEDVVRHFMGIREGDVLFIDEIHGLPRSVEECCYAAMEDFQIPVAKAGYDRLLKQIGMASTQPTVEMRKLPQFTVIGATTLAGLVSDPLRSRFVQIVSLQPYTDCELRRIILNAAARMAIPLPDDAAMEIARRSRSTARVAIAHLRWVVEYCTASDCPPSISSVCDAFALREVDCEGLTTLDRQYLQTLAEAGVPLGLSTLASTLGESPESLELVVEPFLIRKGYVSKGPRGRMPLPKALEKVAQQAAAT